MKMARKGKWATILLVAGVVLLGAVSVWGTTYNVVPGQSIQAAIDAASPGDTINVAAGTYAEYLHITTDNLIVQGAGIDQTIIDLDGLTPYWHYDSSGSYASRGGILISSYGNSSLGHNMAGGSTELIENVILKGFTVRNAGVNPPGGNPEYYDENGDGREDITGIKVGSGKGVLIENCKVEASGDFGISFGRARKTDAGTRPPSEDPTVKDCNVLSNHDTGINIGSAIGNALITDNIVDSNLNPDAPDNHAKGICVAGRSNSALLGGIVSGNTTTGNRYYGIEIYKYTDGFTVENNTVTGQNLDDDAAGIFVSNGWGTTKICRNHVVKSNVVTGNIRGIITYFATDSTIEENTVTTDSGVFPAGQAAIKIDNSSGIIVQGNLVGTTGPLAGYGIRVAGGSSGSSFINNTIQGAGFLAIYVSSGGNDNSFTGNTINGATLAAFGIHTIGTGNTFTGNTIAATPWVWYTNYSVQTVVRLAHAGDSIYVAAGDYVEQVVINEDLVLQGEPGASIKSPGSQTYTIAESSKTFDPIVFAYGGTMVGNHVSGPGVINADIKDLDIDGQNNAQAHPVRFVGILYRNVDGTISGNTIHDMYDADGKGNGPETFGILVYGDSTVEILNNHISEFSRGGIGVSGDLVGWAWGPAPDPVALVQGNTVIGNGFEPETGWWAENGIQFGYGATGQIIENTVTGCWSNSDWSSTGILIVGTEGVEVLRNLVDDNETGIAVMGLTVWGGNPSADNLIQGNDVTNSDWGIGLQYDANTTTILENVISGNYAGIEAFGSAGIEPVGTEVHYNSIAGNTYGFINWNVLADINATLNWWGAADGPSADLDQDGTWDYAGGGDAIWGTVVFSPWLGIDPDGNPTLPGVQITGPMLIIVAPVGPEPTGGYLNTAIAGANSPDLPYADTIKVQPGTYADNATVTAPVTIESQEGCPSTTFIDGNLVLGSTGIQVGSLRHGFTIGGNLTVGAGVNAAQIHVNWNNIEGQVTNTAGIGSLDATYNFWGADGPLDNIVGQVHYHPYLPIEVCAVIQYMDDYGLNPNQAIVMARKVLKHVNPKDVLAAFGLVNVCGMTMDDALALAREYGRVKVQRALRLAHGDCAKLYTQLVGYGVGGGAGGSLLDKQIAGGGGAIEGVTLEASYTQGDTIHVAFTLTDPITGDMVTDAVATLSVVRVTPGEIREFIYWGTIPYDSVSGQYQLDYDTSGLIPGYYDLYIGTSDGQTKQLRVEIVAP